MILIHSVTVFHEWDATKNKYIFFRFAPATNNIHKTRDQKGNNLKKNVNMNNLDMVRPPVVMYFQRLKLEHTTELQTGWIK